MPHGVRSADAKDAFILDNSKHDALIAKHFERTASGVLHLGGHLGQETSRYKALGKSVVWIEALLPHIYSSFFPTEPHNEFSTKK